MDPKDIEIAELRYALALVIASSVEDFEQVKVVAETILSMERPKCLKEEYCGSNECKT